VERGLAYLVSAAVLAAVLYPLSWPRQRDSFPLSNYPMFARGRRSAALTLIYGVAVGPGDERRFVPPKLVGNREVLQARAVFDRAARGGRRGALELCRAIAARVAAGDGLAGAHHIQIVRGRHDAIAYFDRGALGREKVLARCPVGGGAR